jgi:hypothetical protein
MQVNLGRVDIGHLIFCDLPDAICTWILRFVDQARWEDFPGAFLRKSTLGVVNLVHTDAALALRVHIKLCPVGSRL